MPQFNHTPNLMLTIFPYSHIVIMNVLHFRRLNSLCLKRL